MADRPSTDDIEHDSAHGVGHEHSSGFGHKQSSDQHNKHGQQSRSITDTFLEYESFLKRFIRRFLTRSYDIDDVVQDAYLKALCAEKKQKNITSPKAFLFRIARNEALNELRRRSRSTIEYIDDLSQSEPVIEENSLESEAIAKQRLGLFCQSALEMTPRCRRIFLMCKVYGLSHKEEVATQLNISVSGVEKQVAKGLSICGAYIDRVEQPQYSGLNNSVKPLVGAALKNESPVKENLR